MQEHLEYYVDFHVKSAMGSTVSKQMLQERHVVIIGGGYAGCELGTIMLKWNVPFTIVDPKEYFHLTMGALRATVDPSKLYSTTLLSFNYKVILRF